MLRRFRLENLPLRRALVAILLANLLAVVVMAAAPKAHEWVHDDAHAENHSCAVTLFSHGAFKDGAVTPLFVAFCALLLARLDLPRLAWVESLFLSQGVLEHAPPAA